VIEKEREIDKMVSGDPLVQNPQALYATGRYLEIDAECPKTFNGEQSGE
jgi:hypothetical protein